ncbi:MAG: LysR family transcriptional regulator [Burkholderiales bacterium]
MEIYQLRTFVAVAEKGHLTRAAEQLHITQPAVTSQIKALEEELGITLFERNHAGVTLTKAGQTLLSEAEKTLAAAHQMINTAKSLQGIVTGKARLGIVVDSDFLRLGSFLNELLAHLPLLEIKLHHALSGAVMEDVRSGALDGGFFIGTNNDPKVAAIELRRLNYHIVAPPSYRDQVLAAGWRDIAAMPWIRTARHSSQSRLAEEMFREQGLEPRHVLELDEEVSLSSLVNAGVGLCLMREDLALEAAAAKEAVIWPHARRRTALHFIHLKTREHDPAIVGVLSVLRRVWSIPK